MKPWEIWSWVIPDDPKGEPHPAVILSTEERSRLKPVVSIVVCTSVRAGRLPLATETILDEADGLDWPTLCKCDVVWAARKSELTHRRGLVTLERRRAIAERVIRGLGLAGL